MMEELWTIEETADYLKVTKKTIGELMKDRLTEGIHWTRIGARSPRFNVALVKHWAACGEANPELHQEAIAHHIKQLNKVAGKRK
jgi:hypothetical protein